MDLAFLLRLNMRDDYAPTPSGRAIYPSKLVLA